MASTDVLVIGTGSLARAIANAFAVCAEVPAALTVAGRDARTAAGVAVVAAGRAAAAGRPVTGHGASLDAGVADLLARTRPGLVVQCASLQSPWESRGAPSAWTDLVARAGFGITLPLQARLAISTGEAVAAMTDPPTYVNACFPDAVNPVLAGLGLPVRFGIGNVATLSAGLRAALGTRDGRLRVVAHHVHLHPAEHPEDDLRAWLDDEPVTDAVALLAAHRAADRVQLNEVTGYAAARLFADLLAGRDVATNLPGPLGLPGGYPVRIANGTLTLDLPAGLSTADAVAHNRRAEERDGVRVEADRVRFTADAAAELARYAPDLAEGFSIVDTSCVADRLVELRDRLRTT